MDEDATLEDFLEAEKEDPTDERDPAEGRDLADERNPADADASDPDREIVDATGVEPAGTTYAFTPEGAPCAVCGTVVDRRWHADGTLVCPACKAW